MFPREMKIIIQAPVFSWTEFQNLKTWPQLKAEIEKRKAAVKRSEAKGAQ